MSLDIFLFNWTTITTYFHPVVVDILPRNLSAVFEDCVNGSRNIVQFLSDNLSSPIEFTDLQLILLTVFLGFTGLNLALIVFYWNKYGNVITDRFIRPSKCVVYYWHDYESFQLTTTTVWLGDVDTCFNKTFCYCRYFEGNRRIEIIGC